MGKSTLAGGWSGSYGCRLVPPATERCYDFLEQHIGPTRRNYKRQQRQMEKLIRTRALQDDNGRGRSKDGESRCKESTGELQSDMRGMACAQERMEL